MTKEEFMAVVKSHGFKSMRQFCKEAEIDIGNLYKDFNGDNMSIRRMFKVANVLGEPYTYVVRLFYPEECQENDGVVMHKFENTI